MVVNSFEAFFKRKIFPCRQGLPLAWLWLICASVNRSLTWRQVFRPFLGGTLALAWLALSLVAANGPLHQALHHDGAKSSNDCAICHLAKGLVDVADSSVPQKLVSQVVDASFTELTSVLPQQTSFVLPPGRAPPQFSAVS
jgi:hypothetical protein